MYLPFPPTPGDYDATRDELSLERFLGGLGVGHGGLRVAKLGGSDCARRHCSKDRFGPRGTGRVELCALFRCGSHRLICRPLVDPSIIGRLAMGNWIDSVRSVS